MSKICRICEAHKDLEQFRERMLRGVKIRIGTCRACESAARKVGASKLTPADVRRIFTYDPVAGEIRWNKRNDDPKFKLAGQLAGTHRRDGRGVIVHKNGFFLSSHIAWAWMTGEWPSHIVDHADNDPSNDAWSNLRAATKAQNGYNKRKKPRTSSAFKGVCFARHAHKWRAEIVADGKRRHLGYFESESDAANAYELAAIELHGEFARLA